MENVGARLKMNGMGWEMSAWICHSVAYIEWKGTSESGVWSSGGWF